MIETKAATADERDEMLRLIRGQLAERFVPLGQLTGLSWPEFEALYRTRGEVRTLWRDGGVVGYYWAELRGRELHLHAIFVFPQHRGQGIGSAAIEALGAQFRDEADFIELGVEMSNDRARRLYERQGFTVEGRLLDLGFLIMRKRLRPAGEELVGEREIEIEIGNSRFLVRLNETKTAQRLLASLPLRGDGDFWGEEIYFDVGVELPEENPKADVLVGDVAYWRPGTALCLFFGRTPASTGDAPRAASPVTVIGRLVTDPGRLREAKDLRGIEVRPAARN